MATVEGKLKSKFKLMEENLAEKACQHLDGTLEGNIESAIERGLRDYAEGRVSLGTPAAKEKLAELDARDDAGRIYITGDTHGSFYRVEEFCRENGLGQPDIVVILGDVGLNYYGGVRDRLAKERLGSLGPTFLCIHGNHEMRPETVDGYHEKPWQGGSVYVEDDFPNLLFAKDGEVYELNELSAIAIGGAYSIDKHYRLARGWAWFADEQPSPESKALVERKLEEMGWQVDLVLTHTCPLKHEPTEVFLKGVDQSTVDKSTEEWLDEIESRLDYGRWLCGHFHTSKEVGRLRFMYEDWTELTDCLA